MTANTRIIDMTTVPRKLPIRRLGYDINHGKWQTFKANFYTGLVGGETSNHTHKVSNFRASNDDDIIQHKRNKSTFISDIIDVGTNGKKILDDVKCDSSCLKR